MSSDIYRDPSEGANAKRQDLLRRRRDELAVMPHAVRRVVVARTARMAAGMALALGGAILVLVTQSHALVHALDRVLPGVQPAGAATVLSGAWLLAVACYAFSRARSEHRFAVAMSKFVLPGGDLDHDLQRLDHEHPDEMARGMAHHREVGSAAWPVLGAALAVPPLALYVVHAIVERGWPVMASFEAALAEHHRAFAACGVAGLLGALAMTRQAVRAPKATAALLGLAFALGVVATAAWSPAIAALAVVPATMGLIVRRLRIERAAIAAVDPAAGSELFSFRDMVRAIGASLRAAGRLAGRPATLRAVAAIAIAGIGWQYMHRVKRAPQAAPAPMVAIAPAVTPVPVPVANEPDMARRQGVTGVGTMRFEVDLDGHTPVVIPHLDGMSFIPDRWAALIDLRLVGGDALVTPFVDETPEVIKNGQHTFTADSCEHRVPLGMRIVPTGPQPSHVTIDVKISVVPVSCGVIVR